MPIAPETFAGMDLTRMELLMHSLFEKHRKQREAVYGPSKADQNVPVDSTTPAVDEAVQTGSPIIETAQAIPAPANTFPPQSAKSETFSAAETEAASAPAADPAESKTDRLDEKVDKGKGKAMEAELEVVGDGKEEVGDKNANDSTGHQKEVTEEVTDTRPPPGPTKKVHGTYRCDGCFGPIVGSRFRCLE